jgi:4'-phosphopantetheinyl transferase
MNFDSFPKELPALFPPLSAHTVCIWRVDLDRPHAALEELAACLIAEERQRADRFVREVDRRRFTVSHAVLRMLLGRYLNLPPEHVEMSIAPGGKPELTRASGTSCPRFNLSHSERLALIALTMDRAVGVDVEHVRPMTDVKNIVERYFAPREQAVWHVLLEQERLAAFFRCWTRKEAYLKAQGIGLSGGLDHFEVSFAPDDPVRLIRDDDRPDATTRWQLHDVAVEEGYVAACAVEREVEKILVFDWPASTAR